MHAQGGEAFLDRVPSLAGLAEATVRLILAFALLAVTWLLVAVGLRRQA